jgi:hypothetical protein
MRLSLAQFAGHLSHAGRLAAVAEPLSPLPTPASIALFSLPASAMASVPKTVPPDGPPLSVSQLGAARTSLSEGEPVMSQMPRSPMTGTAMGGPAAYGAPPAYGAQPPYYGSQAAPLAQQARPKRRSGLLISALVIAVLGGGGAVGYAAYQAADNQRVVVPPLPDAVPTATTSEGVETIKAENPDVGSTGTNATSQPTAKPTGTVIKPTGAGGSSSTGPVIIGTGGTSPVIQFPFPIPSGIQIPTALPSSIQLPPGFSFPPGFPGLPPQPPTTTPGPAGAPTSTPTATPTTTPSPRPRQSGKP